MLVPVPPVIPCEVSDVECIPFTAPDETEATIIGTVSGDHSERRMRQLSRLPRKPTTCACGHETQRVVCASARHIPAWNVLFISEHIPQCAACAVKRDMALLAIRQTNPALLPKVKNDERKLLQALVNEEAA